MEINLPMSPPVNNLIQGNIYDRLDAIAFEKVRVANSLLDTKRSMQERVINKYRKDAERVHLYQTDRLRREFKKIRKKKPDYVFDESEATARSKERSLAGGRQRALSEPGTKCTFCTRYYSHHYNYRDESKSKKKDQDPNKSKRQNDYFNMTLRLFFLNMMNHARDKGANHYHHHDHHEDRDDTNSNRKHNERATIKPHSYDPRFPQAEREERNEPKRSQSVETWIKEAEADDSEICDELKDLHDYPDETDVFSNSLNTSKFSLDSSVSTALPKPKLSHSLNFPSCTSIPEESRMDVKEDKELWKRSKRAFEKIFAGLL